MPDSARAQSWLLLLIALMLFAYLMPWIVGTGASLTFGAYDLAEWTSLHPAVRGGNPALLTTLFLRAPLAVIALIAAFAYLRHPNLSVPVAVLVLILAAAQLPPLEFFTIARGDPNYQQQFALSAVTLVGSLLASRRAVNRFRLWIAAALAVVGAVGSGLGLAQAVALMQEFDIPIQIGLGGPFLIALFVSWAVVQLWTVRRRGKQIE